MNRFLRLLSLAMLATAAFAQTSAPAPTSALGSTVPEQATPAQAASQSPSESVVAQPERSEPHPDLQPRSQSGPAVLPTATVLRLKLDRGISTSRDRAGEPFTAALTQPVDVDGHTVIPAGFESKWFTLATGAR